MLIIHLNIKKKKKPCCCLSVFPFLVDTVIPLQTSTSNSFVPQGEALPDVSGCHPGLTEKSHSKNLIKFSCLGISFKTFPDLHCHIPNW